MASLTKSPSATSTNKPEAECSPPLRAATNRKPLWMEKSEELLRAPKRALPTSRVYGTIGSEPESPPPSDDNNNSGHGSKGQQSDAPDPGTGTNTEGNKYSHPSETKKINSEDDVQLGKSGGSNNNQRTITEILPLEADLAKPSPSRRPPPPPPTGCGVDESLRVTRTRMESAVRRTK